MKSIHTTIRIPQNLLKRIEKSKPATLSRHAHILLLLEKQLNYEDRQRMTKHSNINKQIQDSYVNAVERPTTPFPSDSEPTYIYD